MSLAKILLIAGSPSAQSRSARLLTEVGQRLQALGHEVSPLAVRDLSAQALVNAQPQQADIAQALQALAQADAIVLATPVYKAAYSGLLKAFIDLWPQHALKDKLVLPLATGGSAAHTLAIDYALRPVLQTMSPRDVLPGVYAADALIEPLEDGSLWLSPEIAQRVEDSISRLAGALALQRHERLAQQVAQAAPLSFAQLRCSV